MLSLHEQLKKRLVVMDMSIIHGHIIVMLICFQAYAGRQSHSQCRDISLECTFVINVTMYIQSEYTGNQSRM